MGGSRVGQCKNNTKQWVYLAAVLVLSSEVLQAALVSAGISGWGSRVSQCKNNTKQWVYLAAVLVLSSEVLQAALVSAGIWGWVGVLESANVRTTQNNGCIWQQFWSCHQRFFKQLR